MNFIFFDRTAFTERLDISFYFYCLLRRPALIKYLPARLFIEILNIFGLVREEKYFDRRWRFLRGVNDPLGRAAGFWKKRLRKVYNFFPEQRNLWLSRWPEPVLRPLGEQLNTVIIAPSFDLVDGKYSPYEDLSALYRRALKSYKPTLVLDGPYSQIRTGADTLRAWHGRVFENTKKCRVYRFVFGVYTFLALLGLGVGLGLISMYFGASRYLLQMFMTYFSIPLIPVLNILPVAALVFLLYFIFNRVWLSFAFSSLITMVFSLINYFKLEMRNDPLLAADLKLISETNNMLGRYEIQFTWKIYLAFALCILAVIGAAILVRSRIGSPRVRLISVVVIICLGVFAYSTVYINPSVYNMTENYELVSRWSATGQYVSRGFVYPFINSIKSAKVKPPEGYDETAARNELARRINESIPEKERISFIVVQLEAFNDFSKYKSLLSFTEDIYEPFHELAENSVSGELITDVFAGGTVETEWAFLTGNTINSDYRSNVNSYVRYLGAQGYYCEGSHPCYGWFYNRVNVNEYLGFDTFHYYEDLYYGLSGGIAGDDILFPEIIRLYEDHRASSDRPYFSFSVTYQNHGPYSDEYNYYDKDYVESEGFTAAEMNILNNYFGGIENTVKNVCSTAEYIDSSDDPIVFLVFGDHNPWMGYGNSVYNAMGLDLDFDKEEGFFNYYGTPYIIHANEAARSVLKKQFVGEGPAISPCFLMNQLFSECGWGGDAYMKLASEVMAQTPLVHSTNRYLLNGELTSALPDDLSRLMNTFRCAQYYRRWNFSG
ncbi:MAG: sulfatase-like hydrolase/transferase [Clostridiales bacterium]|nr:sulfatase-like hydrolase/transferase [Clostridiales bacterium]